MSEQGKIKHDSSDESQHLNLKTFDDLVTLAYSYSKHDDYNEDLEKLYKIRRHLNKLKSMIGLQALKENIMLQIMYMLQGFHNDEMMHTALLGPPGVGKTTVAKILADIYKVLGFVSRGKLIIVGREDLVGQYLGETAIKTRNVLEASIGNVLFIDEAYSLGNTERMDSYSKECIDTITKFIGEHPKNFICIIAGYPQQLQECFFDNNPGLDRRFPWKHTLEKYKPSELCAIFRTMIDKAGWKLKKSTQQKSINIQSIFEDNSQLFPNNGGDIQNLINACKMAHGKRVFGGDRKSWKKYLNHHDIKQGFIIYKSQKKTKTELNKDSLAHMYT